MAQVIYNVVEDNGGGLHLCILSDDSRETCTHVFSGWETQAAGSLVTSLAALAAGETNLAHWDGAEADPQGLYDSLTDAEIMRNGGAKIIANEGGLVATERMGAAGSREFYSELEGVDAED